MSSNAQRVGDMVRFRWSDGEEYEGELVEPCEPDKKLDALVRVRGPWPLKSRIYIVTEEQFNATQRIGD